jgi:hypothetical protein
MKALMDLLRESVPDEPYREPLPVIEQPARPVIDEFPEDVAACQKLNLSGLSERSAGNGCKRNTVFHAMVLNSFNKGRLKRDRYDFLCGASKQKSFGWTGVAGYGYAIDCPKCKGAIERYGLSVCDDKRVNDAISLY